MKCRTILTAALIALVASPGPRAQDRQESLTKKLLERLDQMVERLADEELRSETREEIQDLMEMMREQLAQGQDQLTTASDTYRKAFTQAFQGLEKLDLSTMQEGQLKALNTLKGLDLGNLDGLRKINLEALKSFDGLQGLQKIDLKSFEDLDALQGLQKLNLENLKGLEVLQEIDMSKIQDQLGRASVYLQKANEGTAWRDLLERVKGQDPGDAAEKTLERVREILEKSLKEVPDVNTKEIIQKVMESLKSSGRSAGTGGVSSYSTARNLYRALERQDPERASDFIQFERFQQSQNDWQKYAEQATKEWQKYSEQARKQWEKQLEASRKDMEKQMEQALKAYRKALELKKDPGEEGVSFSWGVTAPEGRGSFSVTTPENWFVSPDGGMNFTWGVTAPEGRGSFSVTTPENWSYSTEGGMNFAWRKAGEDGNLFFSRGDGKDTPFFVTNRDDTWFWNTEEKKIEKKDGKEKSDKQNTTPLLELFKKDIDDKRKETDVEVKVEPEFAFSFTEPVIELKVEPEFGFSVEAPVLELKVEPKIEFLFEEPVLELKLEPKLSGVGRERADPQEQIREMVNELRKEMQEIRQLVQKLRVKAKQQSPH